MGDFAVNLGRAPELRQDAPLQAEELKERVGPLEGVQVEEKGAGCVAGVCEM